MTSDLVRMATPADAGAIVQLIQELAAYEKEPPSSVKITEADVLRDGFGERPRFEALIAGRDGRADGLALFFHNYSTWEGRSGIYLEDLFVRESARGQGLGMALMQRLAGIAEERGCRRLDFWVLHWNPTRDFYHRLGIKHMDQWLPYRLDSAGIARLAKGEIA
ncbi:MAG: GNAT family N-acetyltransferase [Alphaproteobacteria bacterium]|nr:GNAT family N-acetyltransferase [Alphaproteobacteria bacterium]